MIGSLRVSRSLFCVRSLFMLAQIEAPLFFFSTDAEPDHGIDDFQNDECSRKRKSRSRKDRDTGMPNWAGFPGANLLLRIEANNPVANTEDSADSVMSSSESS